jgi:endonuclease/exonuclease/phosphatase family metal-dependent hydrolase
MNLRIVTLNFWGLEQPLDRRIALAIEQLRVIDPDVVCLQEVQPRGAGTTADQIAAGLGMRAAYAQACAWKEGAWGPGSVAGSQGLAILSREALVSQHVLELPDRRVGDVRILLSGQVATSAGPIWIHTTHLHYKLDDGVARERQVLAIDAYIRTLRTDTSPPQILCGDFNATPDSDEIRFLRGLTTLDGRRTHFQDAWLRLYREAEAGDGPAHGITWSSENAHTRPLRSLDLDRRIDYIFVTTRKKDGRGTVHRCEVVLTARDAGGDCASDHYGVLAEIQIAPGHGP